MPIDSYSKASPFYQPDESEYPVVVLLVHTVTRDFEFFRKNLKIFQKLKSMKSLTVELAVGHRL